MTRNAPTKDGSRTRAWRVVSFLILACQASVHPQHERTQGPASPALLETQIEESLAHGAPSLASTRLHQLLRQPHLPSALLLRAGIAFAERGLYAEASQAFERAAHDNPNLFEAHYNLALARLADNRAAAALSAIDSAPYQTQQEATARLYLRGKIEAALGQEQQAARDLSAAFVRDPQEENYALDLGLFWLRAKRYQQAEAVFARASASNPRSPYLLLGLALAQFLAGRTAKCVETSRRLFAVAPEFSVARLLLGFALYVQGDWAGAAQTVAEGLKLANPDPYLFYLDAVIRAKQQPGDERVILADLAIAERALPSCALCYIASGKVRQQHNDWAGALTDFQQAIRLDPNLAEGWYHLASVYERLGRHSEAAQARQHFQHIKTSDELREKEMMRSVLLQTLQPSHLSHVH